MKNHEIEQLKFITVSMQQSKKSLRRTNDDFEYCHSGLELAQVPGVPDTPADFGNFTT